MLDKEIVINDDAEETGITSDVNLEETQVTDEETPEETGEPEEKSTETKEGEEEANDPIWKKRYADSTTEFQRLQIKLKEGEGLTAQERVRADRLQQELDEALAKLKDEKPETYDNVTLKKTLDQNSRELAELKEKAMLDDFISENPIAKPYREALKAHSRAFPTKPMADIWSEGFKDVAEARQEVDEKKKAHQKASQPDKGKGTSTGDPTEKKIGGYTEEEFNKLPVAKRREILIKSGEKY